MFLISYRMPHQLLCRLAECVIFNFYSTVKLQFHFCHICVILLLLSEINCVYVYVFFILSDSTVSKFVTKKWTKVNDLSSSQYSVNKNISFKTSMLRSALCDYSDAYIVVEGRITVEGDNDAKANKMLIF